MPGFFLTKLMLQRCLLVAVLSLTLGIYWIGLNGPLLFDDTQNLAPINAWLQGRLGWESVVFDNSSGLFGRYVAMASFLANAAIFGDGIWGFKFVNLLLHLFNGVVIFALLSGVQRRIATGRPEQAADFLPVLAASIWLVHPLLVSTVLYVVQRMAILSTTFSLITMLAYLHGRLALDAGDRRRAWCLLAIVPITTLAASLSKENGILAPALCGLIEWLVFQPVKETRRSQWARGWIGITLVLPAILAVVLTAVQNRYLVGGYANRPFSLAERLLTQSRVLWDYIGSILLPYGPKLGLYHDDYTVSAGILQPASTLFAILGLFGLAAIAWRLRILIPGFAFGVAVFFVGHALESTVFPLLMYFEHRNYLPAAGIIWAVLSLASFGAAWLKPRMHNAKVVFAGAATFLVLTLALATWARSGIWSSVPTLLAQDLTYHPNSPWLRIAAASWALDQHPPRPELARRHLEHLLESADRDIQRLGAGAYLIVDCSEGRGARPDLIAKAFSGYPKTLQSDLLTTYESLADAVAKNDCPGLAPLQYAAQLNGMLDRMKLPGENFMMRRLRYKTARMYLEAGDLQRAKTQAKLAHDDKAVIAPMTALLAEIELRQGHVSQAAHLIELAASKVAPRDATGQKILGALRKHTAEMRAQQQKKPQAAY